MAKTHQRIVSRGPRMARKKQSSIRIKRLTLDLHEPLHRAIKKNAAEEGVTMAQKLRALLMKHYRLTEEPH